MKACPGLRSGIDRSSSLSLVIPAPQFVIPAIKSMPRTPIRGRNPERVGRGECSAGPCPQPGAMPAWCLFGPSGLQPKTSVPLGAALKAVFEGEASPRRRVDLVGHHLPNGVFGHLVAVATTR